MISSIKIENFKSYKSGVLRLGPLTVLIGANASGKSNAIEAMRLLSWIAEGNKLNSVKYAIQEGSKVVRGRVSELGHNKSNTFKFSCNAPLTSGVYSPNRYETFTQELATTQDDELFIVDERVTGKNSTVPLYEVVERHTQVGHDLLVAYNNFARGGIKPKVACMDQQAVFIQLESSARYAANHRQSQRVIPHVSSSLQSWLGGIHFLDPAPSLMRDYSFKSEHILNETGSNISGTLYNICATDAGKNEVLEFIKSLPEQDINDITFLDGPRGDVVLSLTETFGDMENKFDASLLSDGTLRVLAIAAIMLTADEGSLVVIEEIDNGVHPSRAETLLRRISDVAEQRRLRVLISSHNPALLNALPDKAVPDIVFCFRGVETGSSRLVRLKDLERYPELVGQGRVGDLMTAGLIDKYAKLVSNERRKNISQEWLATLRRRSVV